MIFLLQTPTVHSPRRGRTFGSFSSEGGPLGLTGFQDAPLASNLWATRDRFAQTFQDDSSQYLFGVFD